MPAAVESVEISRRPEEVFNFMFEPTYYSEWDPSIVSVHREDSSRLTVGSKTIVLHRMGPVKVSTTEELIEFSPPRQFANRGVSGPLAGVSRCIVEPLNDGRRSRLTLSLEIEARGLGKLFLPLALSRGRKILPKQLKKIKEILESGAVIADR